MGKMRKLVLITMAVVGLSFSVHAEAKMSKKRAKAACKAEMPGATKKEMKACIKQKQRGS